MIGADYTWTHSMDAPRADALSAEQWAREVFEGSPGVVRIILGAGWRMGLGLRLLPSDSPMTVLGWRLSTAGSDSATLRAESKILQAENSILVSSDTVTWNTAVTYRTWLGRMVWSMARPVHQLTIPILIARAKRHLAAS